MTNTYRGRLVAKNQMTIPVQMQRELKMVRGDELEFVLTDGRVSSIHVLKPLPVNLLPDNVVASLMRRRAVSIDREFTEVELLRFEDGEEIDAANPDNPVLALEEKRDVSGVES